MNLAELMAMVMLQIGLCSKSLLGAFNDTDAAVPDAVVAVPAIVELRERAAPSAAETAAVLARFKLGGDEAQIGSRPRGTASIRRIAGCRATSQPHSRLAAGLPAPPHAVRRPRLSRPAQGPRPQHHDSRAAISPAVLPCRLAAQPCGHAAAAAADGRAACASPCSRATTVQQCGSQN